MLSGQQSETCNYFNKNAVEWSAKSKVGNGNEVNVIKQRNDYVAGLFREEHASGVFLDVGCGSGELVVQAASRFRKAVGIDFAEAMIKCASENALKSGFKNIELINDSVFEFNFGDSFDLISANGFIEYISAEELSSFLKLANHMLVGGGQIAISSRNRLFNLYSANEYTELEMKCGMLECLAKEAIIFSGAAHIGAIIDLIEHGGGEMRGFDSHPDTGIEVKQRFQYTPLQLSKLLADHGFAVRDIFPIHIHGVVPSFKKVYPEAHCRISNFLHEFSGASPALVPVSSTFMICASKRS